MVVPVGDSAEDAGWCFDGLDGVAVVVGPEVAEVVAVDDIEEWGFAAEDGEMRMGAGQVGQEGDAAGAEIGVVTRELGGVEGGEVVGGCEGVAGEVELEDGVAVVAAALIGVEAALAGDYEDVAVTVGGGADAGPDAGGVSIRRGVEDGSLLESVGVITDDPAVVWGMVTEGCPREVDRRRSRAAGPRGRMRAEDRRLADRWSWRLLCREWWR